MTMDKRHLELSAWLGLLALLLTLIYWTLEELALEARLARRDRNRAPVEPPMKRVGPIIDAEPIEVDSAEKSAH